MKAIILAAGRGSRMKNLTSQKPKCLIEYRARPLLSWQIESIRGAGLVDIGLVTGYRRETLQQWGLREFHNPNWEKTNMVSSLACAEEWLNEDICIISYSDIFYPSTAIQLLMNSSADLAITYDKNWLEVWSRRFQNPLEDAETFKLNSEGNILDIGRRPQSIEEVKGQYMGLIRITPKSWLEISRIRESLSVDELDTLNMTALLQQIVNAGRIKIKAHEFEGVWGEIDHESDLAAYE